VRPLEYASNVRVAWEDRRIEGETSDRVGGVGAHAGKLGEIGRPAVRRNVLGCPMEADCAAVVAKSLPRADDVGEWGGGERFRRWPAFQPPQITGHDPLDLRLLEHDLRDEYGVWVPCVPPRQVAAVAIKPGEKRFLHPIHPSG
jgi:hypothetical protein